MTTDEMRKGFGTAAGKTAQVAAYHKALAEAANEIDRLRKQLEENQTRYLRQLVEVKLEQAKLSEQLAECRNQYLGQAEMYEAVQRERDELHETLKMVCKIECVDDLWKGQEALVRGKA